MLRQRKELKIAYALVCYGAAYSGVFNKIKDQVDQWKIQGFEVQLFVITDLESKELWYEIDQKAVLLVDISPLSKIYNRFRLINLAINTNPSLVYIRDSFPMRFSKTLIPLVIEIQSRVAQELKMRSNLKYFIFYFFKKYFYSRVTAAVYVTNELKNLNEFRFEESIPKIAIGNAINFDRIEALSPQKNVKPALFFVGHPNQAWHGISELLEFAKTHPEIDFHIVGTDDKSPLPNVNFYGKLRVDEYRHVAEKCTAGVGSLKLTINQMKEASPLKVREYLALGLPVILKYQDTDLDPSLDFVLQLPLNEKSLEEYSDEITSFLSLWSNKRVPRSQILNLDVGKKEEIRLGFFESVLNNDQK